MAYLDFLFGPTKGEARAAEALRKAEDRLLRYDPQESVDLAYHIIKSKDRQEVVLTQSRLNEIQSRRRDNRNLTVTIILFMGLFLSKGYSLSDVLNGVGALFGLHH